MLIKAKTLKGFKLSALDGDIGRAIEFYFDDRYWAVRYLVADTGSWLRGKLVLLSPYALREVIKDTREIFVELTKKQIEDGPLLDSDKPVSRQFEINHYGYYGWPTYWSGAFMWGGQPYIERDRHKWLAYTPPMKVWNSHLRSSHEVSHYHIHATDGEVGHVKDFIVDSKTWAIRYLIVDTKNWWPGKQVLVAPQWIESVSWGEGKVFVNVTREMIKNSKEYKDASSIDRNYETSLFKHYQQPPYWLDGPQLMRTET